MEGPSRVCASCGTANDPAARFCGNCGTRLLAAEAAAATPATPRIAEPLRAAPFIARLDALIAGVS